MKESHSFETGGDQVRIESNVTKPLAKFEMEITYI
jgi:hypothetical protein